ncbi:CCA tRNA nucleotidyltransferase [Brevibacillus sp. TJ4]|uniref:CCA tRNA nucleotidyltransferase n=1 Tax=Brevibacillus sp. TJ4 TaxID=3234853 RepID=UPI0037D8B80E
MGYEQAAVRIIEKLEEHGFEAYFVGGCVRDWLLGRTVHDIDICTNAHPGDVISLFPDHVPTGLKHGTVSVKMDGYLFEVTTFRTEGKYEDYRRPADVQFVSDLKLDLERRDFTINAMAMDRDRRLYDPFGGQQDAQQQLIRAVGEPGERFREDALRLLRAARFAAQLGFSIEEQTLHAMRTTAPLLAHIAVERVREELNKLLNSPTPERGCQIIQDTSLLLALPGLQQLFAVSCPQAWRLVHVGSVAQKWALLLYAAGYTCEQARQVCLYLRMSKRETEDMALYVQMLREIGPQWDRPAPVAWGTMLLRHGLPVCQQLHELLRACWWQRRSECPSEELMQTYEALPVKSGKELAINGRDLQDEIGKKAGEWVAHVLHYLLEQTALHGLPNTREALIEAARKEVIRNEY